MIKDRQVDELLADMKHCYNRPLFFTEYVEWASHQTCSPKIYHIASALQCLSWAIPQDHNLVQYYAGTLHNNLFTMIVGRSGDDMKSTSLGLSKRIIRELNGFISYHPASAEGLIEMLAEQPNQLFLYSEMGKFLSQSGSGYAETLKTTFTDLWDCEPQSRKRAGMETIKVDQPYVGIHSACSLPYLEKYTKPVDWNGGFLGRFLLFYGRSERTEPDPQPYQLERVHELCERLKKRKQKAIGKYCGLDMEAKRYWADWYNELQEKCQSSKIAGTRTRLPAIVRKLAFYFAFDAHRAQRNKFNITEDDLMFATRIGDMHLESVEAIASLLCDDEDQKLRRKIIRSIENLSHTAPDQWVSRQRMLRDLRMRWSKIKDWMNSLEMECTISVENKGRNDERYKITDPQSQQTGV